MAEPHLIPLDALRSAMRLVVQGFGSSSDEVAAVADNLIDANLTGHDSHGIGMLPRYAQAYREGCLKPNAHVRVLRPFRSGPIDLARRLVLSKAESLIIETHGYDPLLVQQLHQIGLLLKDRKTSSELLLRIEALMDQLMEGE